MMDYLLISVEALRKNNLEIPVMAINISMMAREPRIMITCPSSKEDANRALSWYARSAKEKEPGLKESQYRKDDSHRRPMSDTHDECQTLPQGRLPGKVAPHKLSEVCNSQAQRVRQNINGMNSK